MNVDSSVQKSAHSGYLLQKSRFNQLSKMARVVRVLTFGDSLTAGYTGGYSAQFHPYADFIKSKRF